MALGPIIDERQRDNVDRIVRGAKDAGASIEAGGTFENLFYAPTVLTDLTPENPAWAEEIFGPVAPVMSYSTVEEAAELINASEYALSLGILGDVGQAMRLTDLVDAGKVHINEQTVADESDAPIGRDEGLRQRGPLRRLHREHRGLHRGPVAHHASGDRPLPVLGLF